MFDDLLSEDDSKNENKKEDKRKYKYDNSNKNTLKEPYVPVAFYVDRDFPSDIKDKLYSFISKLIQKGVTVRLNGDDKDFVHKVKSLSDKNIEIYIPWKNFNDIESKHYYNTAISKETARINFLGWEKVPDLVRSILARNVRMLFGDRNNSITLCLITWSSDGANKLISVTNVTGKVGFIIKLACKYFIPVINLGKPNSESIIEKIFSI